MRVETFLAVSVVSLRTCILRHNKDADAANEEIAQEIAAARCKMYTQRMRGA
jgi:hypothetical protein